MHTYLLVLLAVIGAGLSGLVAYHAARYMFLVAVFLFGAGGERRRLAAFHAKLRIIRLLAKAMARWERARTNPKREGSPRP